MSESMIKYMFSIIGTLLVSLLLFALIFGTVGQQFMWRAIEPAMLNQWQESTMDNGARRTLIYEEEYMAMESVKYNGQGG